LIDPQAQGQGRFLGFTPRQLNVGFLTAVGAAAAGICVWLFAFGGLDSITGDSTTEEGVVDTTAREISNADLERIALRPEQFPTEYAGFAADEDNGPLTLEKNANQAFDPIEQRAQFESSGWVTGYDAAYRDRQPAPDKAFFLDTQLDLFKTVDGAAGFFTTQMAEATQHQGQAKDNVTEVEASLFDVSVDEQSAGFRGHYRVQLEDGSQREYWQIGIAFRRGRLLGSVTLAGLELSDAGRQVLEGHAADLANRLNNQMTAALSTR